MGGRRGSRMRNWPHFLCPFLLALVAPAVAGEKPDVHRQLLELADRQQKIFDVTNNIARGKNK